MALLTENGGEVFVRLRKGMEAWSTRPGFHLCARVCWAWGASPDDGAAERLSPQDADGAGADEPDDGDDGKTSGGSVAGQVAEEFDPPASAEARAAEGTGPGTSAGKAEPDLDDDMQPPSGPVRHEPAPPPGTTPDEETTRRMEAFEGRLVAVMQADGAAVHVAVLDKPGVREWHFYLGGVEPLDEKLERVFEGFPDDCPVSVRIGDDPEWEEYRAFVALAQRIDELEGGNAGRTRSGGRKVRADAGVARAFGPGGYTGLAGPGLRRGHAGRPPPPRGGRRTPRRPERG